MKPQSGQMLARFRLAERIGAGGMGEVWRAFDTGLERDVAIKFINQSVIDDPRSLKFFAREAKAAAALNHPNIVTVYSVEESEGVPYIVMELVRGSPLAEIIPRSGFELDQFFSIAISLADALSESHRRQITHLDLKPANIIVTADGQAKVVDFGLAILREPAKGRTQDDVSTRSHTHPNMMPGTLPYMSPEQIRGGEVDYRTDIFSLGTVLYQMAVGRCPFHGTSKGDLIASVLCDDPEPLTRARPELPRQLERIVRHCLQKDVTKRFQTALDVRNELDQLHYEMSSDPNPGIDLSEKTSKGGRRTVAVMPLKNLTGDPGSEYFSEGITEELINALGRIRKLKVVSRTSSFEFRDRKLSVNEIGDRFGIGFLLEGGVSMSDERVRITVQLIDTSNGFQVWTEKYVRQLQDVFLIQEEIALKISEVLKVRLLHAEGIPRVAGRTENLEAYRHYLLGRFYWNKQTAEDFGHALEHFRKALELEPDYPPALAGIADYWVQLAFWGLARPADAWPEAKAAAQRTLDCDDSLAEAHISMGLVSLFSDWDASLAKARFLRAIELQPGSAHAHYALTLASAQTGDLKYAHDEITNAAELDPLSSIYSSTHGFVHYYMGDYDLAITRCRTTLEMDPCSLEALLCMALAKVQKNDFEGALADLRTAREIQEFPLLFGVLGYVLAISGRRDEAKELETVLGDGPDDVYVPPIARAMVSSGLGDVESSFRFLRLAVESRDGLVRYLGLLPIFDSLRDRREFREILEELDLPDVRKGGPNGTEQCPTVDRSRDAGSECDTLGPGSARDRFN